MYIYMCVCCKGRVDKKGEEEEKKKKKKIEKK